MRPGDDAIHVSPDHPRGKHKAAFFNSFGFTLASWHVLMDALLLHARTYPAEPTEQTAFGEAHEAVGRLTTPDGRTPVVLVVWFFRNGEDFPRFVTAVPSKEKAP